MKKLLIFVCIFLLAACNNTPQEEKTKQEQKPQVCLNPRTCNENTNNEQQDEPKTQQTKQDELPSADDETDSDQTLNEQIISASRNGNLNKVKELLAKGADINAGNKDGEYPTSPLYEAIDTGNIELIKFLIRHGADVNFEDYNCGEGDCSGDPSSPLIKAIKADNKDIVELLLDKGANIDMEVHSGDDLGMTALRAAVEKNNKEIIDLLLRRGSKDIFVTLARPDLLPALLANGADINSKDLYSQTVANVAKKKQNSKLMQLFSSHGAEEATSEDFPYAETDGYFHAWNNLDRQLVVACKTGDLPLVKILLQYGADINTVTEEQFSNESDTPLICAAESGNYELVKLLLDSGADVNKVSANGKTALSVAKDAKIIQLLRGKNAKMTLFNDAGGYVPLNEMKKRIQQGADLEAISQRNIYVGENKTALYLAVEKNDMETIKLLLDSGANPNTFCIEYGLEIPVLFKAIHNPEMVSLLVSKGANATVNGKCTWPSGQKNTYNYNTTFFAMCAVLNQSTDIIKFLINAGVINGTDEHDKQQLDKMLKIAQEKNYKEIEKLLKSAEKQDTLINASKRGDIDAVKKLITNKIRINIQNQMGDTALIKAAGNGYTDIVKILIQNGADVNAVSFWGGTALIEATLEGYEEIVKLLLEAGADVNAKTEDGNTALNYASKKGYRNIVKLLKGDNAPDTPQYAGSNAEPIGQEQSSPALEKKRLQKKFMRACRRGELSEVEQYLKDGADVNEFDVAEDFPLQQAILSNKPEKVALLLKYGANVNPTGVSVLKLAQKYKNQEIIEMLKSAGAKE